MKNHDDVLRMAISYLKSTNGQEWNYSLPLEGGGNVVYLIEDEDGKSLALRIPKEPWMGQLSHGGQRILRYVKDKLRTPYVPSILNEQEVFSILEYIPGKQVAVWGAENMEDACRRLILEDLASLLYSVWTLGVKELCTAKPITYRQYLTQEVDRGLRRCLASNGRWGSALVYLYRRSLISTLLPESDEALLVIDHGDIRPANIICDASGFRGLIDWDLAKLVPAAAAIHYPAFIANLPADQDPGVVTKSSHQQDRAWFFDAILGCQHHNSRGTIDVASLLRDSRDRQIFALSLHNRQMNAAYAADHFDSALVSVENLRGEWNDFLSRNSLDDQGALATSSALSQFMSQWADVEATGARLEQILGAYLDVDCP